MKNQWLFIFASLAALLFTIQPSFAQYQFTTLDDPRATSGTQAWAISGGTIVGIYHDTAGQHGFIYKGSTYTTLDDPAGTDTTATGISAGDVVGSYMAADSSSQGFIYDGSTYTTISDPLGTVTKAVGLSGNTIVGVYVANIAQHGFSYDGSTYTTLDVPSEFFTTPTSISGGNMVGYYSDANEVSHGFLFNGSTYTSIDDPLATNTASGGTSAIGISGTNIVGTYYDTDGVPHGFLLSGTTYTSVDNPLGSEGTELFGVDGNNLVGAYTDNHGVQHGFLATPPPLMFSEWEAQNSGSGTLTDTPWKDGVPNLLKYFFDIDPSKPMSASEWAALPVASMVTTHGVQYLALTYRQYQLATGISFQLQTSSDLKTWSSDTTDVPQELTVDPQTNDPIMQVEIAMSGSARKFARLRITSL
jgi:hypothetical protein